MNWLSQNLADVVEATIAHLWITLPAVVLSIVIAVPLGWIAHRFRWSRALLLTLIGVLYAIPSFALLISLPTITGFGIRSAENLVIVLAIYGAAVMVRTATDAFDQVDQNVRDSATAIGFSSIGRFWRVELQLAGPILLSGIRVVVVSTVSLATVGAITGVKTLGSLFTDGFQRGIQEEVVTGIVLTVAIALLLDGAAIVIGRLVMPWWRPGRTRKHRGKIGRDVVSGTSPENKSDNTIEVRV